MNQKIKVLQVTSGFRKGVSGGIPSVIHNYCTSDAFSSDIDFDYLSLGYQTFSPYRDELEKNGGELYCLNIHSRGIRQLHEIYTKLNTFLTENKYDIVHVNSGALTQVLISCIAAKRAGVHSVIAHSHNAITKPGIKGKIYTALKPFFYRYADAWFACSEKAAESMFPENILKEKKWVLIPNAIDMNKFRFNEQIRKQYRIEFGISDKYVIGHVGRFNEQKNHKFLINVFAEIASRRDDVVLLMVGEGDLRENIIQLCKEKGIDKKVIFTGQRNDVNMIMQAMDLFAFPSLYEGLGMVLIEAQVAGLNVISTDTLPKETQISNFIKYEILDEHKWVEYINSLTLNENRGLCSSKVVDDGKIFDLATASEYLKKLYIEMSK